MSDDVFLRAKVVGLQEYEISKCVRWALDKAIDYIKEEQENEKD